MENIFDLVVKDNNTHARWLNTLSMMENTGAKKIKKCEHSILATEMILKHAAEEARHAYKLCKVVCEIEKDLFMGWIDAVKKEVAMA